MLRNSRRVLYLATNSKTLSDTPTVPPKPQTASSQQPPSVGEYAYAPAFNPNQTLDQQRLNEEAAKIYKWAKGKRATHYSFIAYPNTSGVCEKQESFLNLKYVKNENESKTKQLVEEAFTGKTLIKGQGDGSSFPSGGLRRTHTARGYTIWDPLSQLYIRKDKGVLYIPALLVSHHGHALDDKTLFRQSQQILKKNTVELLNKLGVNTKEAVILLGLEQEFFAVSKEAFQKRDDLRMLGRALTGNIPPRNQQLGEHYYGTIPQNVRNALLQVEKELLSIGIPFRTKHNEVALNQFQIASICNDAGLAIDQNMIAMEIMKEVFDKHGLAALLHEKPFKQINGSGKHANWSLNYVKPDGSLKNLFAADQSDSGDHWQLYKLFILLNLKAVLKNHRLLMTAIATPGNQIRLGGHQAPPRIISVFLGTALSNLLDGKPNKPHVNLRDIISYLNFDVFQENTDRNRTSPYAYTGNRFEFRALGSSQNPSYALAVITASLAQEIKLATQQISNGKSVETLIKELVEETRAIRFEGNGYSEEWKLEAKRRGLYVNEDFTEIYSFMEQAQVLFEKLGICSRQEIQSRTVVAQENYKETVSMELKTLLLLADRHILPEGYCHMQRIRGDFHSEILDRDFSSFKKLFESSMQAVNELRQAELDIDDDLVKFQKLRAKVDATGDLLSALSLRLPAKEGGLPELHEFLRL